MATITVGAGQQFSTIAAAVAASRDGDVVQVQAGTYTNDFAYVGTDITLQAVGGVVRMNATVPPSDGKAILTTNGDITINGFEFSGARVPDKNGAGIRQEGGNLTILNSLFRDNEMGILTGTDAPDATLTIRNSEFARNGTSGGTAHNLYVNGIAKLEVDNSYFREASVGHELKSRAQETVITNSRFADFDSTASYSIDLPNGGRVVLRDNVIEQGPNSQNPNIVAFGEEGNVWPGSSLEMTGNTVINNLPGGQLLWNATGVTAAVSGTEVFGLGANQLVSGPANVSGTTFLQAAPAFDTSSPWQVGTTAPTVPTTPAEPVTPTEPTTPAEPVTPAEPTTPAEPMKPTEPVKPSEPTKPSEDVPPQGSGGNGQPGGTGDDAFVFGPVSPEIEQGLQDIASALAGRDPFGGLGLPEPGSEESAVAHQLANELGALIEAGDVAALQDWVRALGASDFNLG